MKLFTLTKTAVSAAILFCCGCTKDFLDKKPDQALLVPKSIEELQALLDNHDNVMSVAPGLGVISADNFTTTQAGLTGLNTELERSTYLWNTDVNQQATVADWDVSYKQVFYANIVLEALRKLEGRADAMSIDQLRGAALFYRAYAFYNLAQLFAAPYDEKNAHIMPGVPLPLASDVNIRPGRGTVAETYSRILTDLAEASGLLPVTTAYKTRPSVAAAQAMLARVNLAMERYPEAYTAANKCLQLSSTLLDYNTLNAGAARPLPVALSAGNDEVIYYNRLTAFSFFTSALVVADINLYHSYSDNDLRKTVYYNNKGGGVIAFKGNYTGSSDAFGGLATDEMYLIKAETDARAGNTGEAMQALNALMIKRWKKGTFVALTAANADAALRQVLTERRKELVLRGLRWTDLRRLNKDAAFAVTLSRNINNVVYTLEPGDKRYVLPIPAKEIALSGIEQNER